MTHHPLTTPPDPVVTAMESASLDQLIEAINRHPDGTPEILIAQLGLTDTFEARWNDNLAQRLKTLEADLPAIYEAIADGRTRDTLDLLHAADPGIGPHPDCAVALKRLRQ